MLSKEDVGELPGTAHPEARSFLPVHWELQKLHIPKCVDVTAPGQCRDCLSIRKKPKGGQERRDLSLV